MAGILTYPITFRDLTLNGHYAPDGAYLKANELATYVVEQFDFSRIQIRDQREGLHLDTGGLVGPASRQFRRLVLAGSIRAETPAMLEDMAARLYNAFDVEEAQVDDPQYRGVHELDFYTPSDLAGYADPIHELFLARPVGHPSLFERRSTGQTMAYALELICPDPRRYLFPITQVNFSTALGWSKTLSNFPAGYGAETMPFVVINMNAAGADDFTIADGSKSFVLDLSAQTSDISVDMQEMEIYRNSDGARRDSLRTSGPNSWLAIPAGGVSWTMTHTAGITEVLVGYRQARA